MNELHSRRVLHRKTYRSEDEIPLVLQFVGDCEQQTFIVLQVGNKCAVIPGYQERVARDFDYNGLVVYPDKFQLDDDLVRIVIGGERVLRLWVPQRATSSSSIVGKG